MERNLFHAKPLLELVDTSAGVNQLLLAGIEGVALGANFDVDIFYGRTGLDDFATSTVDLGLLIVGMNSVFHFSTPPVLLRYPRTAPIYNITFDLILQVFFSFF